MLASGIDPMHQFKIETLVPLHVGTLDLSFTNSSLWMAIAVIGASLFLTLAMGGRRMVPSRMQSLAELSYEFIAGMVRSTIGTEGMQYFPFVFTLFIFVLFCNVLGMIPGSFTVTSHIIVTFALAMMVFIGVLLIGFARHGIGFLGLFVPAGVPVFLLPLIVVIEIISFLSRPISLSVRLFANMLAGHTMLKVFGGFVVMLFGAGGALSVVGIAPLLAITAVTALEFLIAFLQAYVFAVLTCIYLNDAIHLHGDHH
ncbi:MAG: F0F1 ATP synthase subunit A [Alphaproteobacteria bacterium]|nr:F0F1 ATP synthase subunit A [Alphaproteobacteria bacterium]